MGDLDVCDLELGLDQTSLEFNLDGAILVCLGTLFHCWFWGQARNLCVNTLHYSFKNTDLILSTLHAFLITFFYTVRLIGYYAWGPEVFMRWGWAIAHLWTNSWVLGYCYMDTYDVWFHPRYKGKVKEQITWTIHHLCLALPTMIFGWNFLMGDITVEWWVTTGYLAEASTLPLNLSKYLHYIGVDPGKWFYIGFLLIYFITRPLNFLGLIYYSYTMFGYRFWENITAISVYLAVILGSMNWYWFFLLWQKMSPWPLFGKKNQNRCATVVNIPSTHNKNIRNERFLDGYIEQYFSTT